jgi:hypothetical protein
MHFTTTFFLHEHVIAHYFCVHVITRPKVVKLNAGNLTQIIKRFYTVAGFPHAELIFYLNFFLNRKEIPTHFIINYKFPVLSLYKVIILVISTEVAKSHRLFFSL